MKKTSLEHTKEFKEVAVILVTEEGYQINELARNLGNNAGMLGRWKGFFGKRKCKERKCFF